MRICFVSQILPVTLINFGTGNRKCAESGLSLIKRETSRWVITMKELVNNEGLPLEVSHFS